MLLPGGLAALLFSAVMVWYIIKPEKMGLGRGPLWLSFLVASHQFVERYYAGASGAPVANSFSY